MARQKGLIQLEGTIGGVNFYIRKGVALARQSGGGFNGKAIKTKASMVRVRENGSEFGAVSKFKKMLRISIHDHLFYCKETTLHGRMMSMLQEIKAMDLNSERGSRKVWKGLETEIGYKLMTSFLFTPKQNLSNLFGGLPTVANLGGSCIFNNLKLAHTCFSKTATHLRMSYLVVDYDANNLEFKRYDAVPVTFSKTDEAAALIDFQIADLPPTFELRMSFLAVQFYQRSSGNLVELKEQGMAGLHCLDIFVVN